MKNNGLFRDLFKEKRLRMSLPRLLVYQELSSAAIALSPQELYRRLIKNHKRIGLTSIYRSLELFASMGIVYKTVNGSSGRYKLCTSEDHHHHIVCRACGDVAEVDFCNIADWSRKVTKSTGFQVTDHQLSFSGLCRACRREE